MSKYTTKNLINSLTIVFGLNFLATFLNWYRLMWWFDMLMHFLGGFFIAWLVIYILMRFSKEKRIIYNSFLIKQVLLWSLVIGLGWEWFEWATDFITGAGDMHMLDSYSDIFFDMAGALTALLLFKNSFERYNLENNHMDDKI